MATCMGVERRLINVLRDEAGGCMDASAAGLLGPRTLSRATCPAPQLAGPADGGQCRPCRACSEQGVVRADARAKGTRAFRLAAVTEAAKLGTGRGRAVTRLE